MPPLTLNQAAKEAAKSKQTILDAIRSGRLTAPKDEQGRYQIDPAELFRVYPPTSPPPDTETETDPTRTDTETALDRVIATLESERDDLRRRLDQSEEAREREAAERREAQSKLTALLTHQPTPKEPPPEPHTAPTPRQWPTPLTYWLAGIAAALAVGWAVWEVWPR